MHRPDARDAVNKGIALLVAIKLSITFLFLNAKQKNNKIRFNCRINWQFVLQTISNDINFFDQFDN